MITRGGTPADDSRSLDAGDSVVNESSPENMALPSFAKQARWNTGLSFAGQIVSVVFVTIISRALGRIGFGHYVWIAALPGLFVVFDLFLGQALQNRLTELYTVGDKLTMDRLLWAFMWGMLLLALAFSVLVVAVLLGLGWLKGGSVGRVPLGVMWLGAIYLSASAMNVPFLAAHVAYNAFSAIHRNAIVTFTSDVVTRGVFILALLLYGTLSAAIIAYSISIVLGQVVITSRFLRLYDLDFQRPSWPLVRDGFRELWTRSSAGDWALTRIIDAVYKNSELVIATFFIGASQVGDFAILDRMSSTLMLAANSVYVPLVPALVRARTNQLDAEGAALRKRAIEYSVMGLTAFTLVYIFAAQPVASLWAGRSIRFPAILVALIGIRAWTRVLSSLFWYLLAGNQLIRSLMIASGVSAGLYLLIYVSLLHRLGITSILVSQIVAQIVFIFLALRGQRLGAKSVTAPGIGLR